MTYRHPRAAFGSFSGVRIWLPGALLGLTAAATPASARHGELPNRVPEPPPYDTREADANPPPYGQHFTGTGGPQFCGTCHQQIYSEWNGSMMSNAWRDPAWRAAFLLIARLTATDGNCDIPAPPDGTAKSHINPFANADCSSTFDTGQGKTTMRGSGSLLDGFCSRCHMPSDYIDNIPLKNVERDRSGIEHGLVNPSFDPTSDRGTGFAFATVEQAAQNSEAGKLGITCTFCHTMVDTRRTPFGNYPSSGVPYAPALGSKARAELLPPNQAEILEPADPSSRTLGYAIGAGAYRLSPQALVGPERFGPLTHGDYEQRVDGYLTGVFGEKINHQKGKLEGAPHKGNYHALMERAEMCATCHDVTNPLTIKNALGRWVGGFPIERTYSEWSSSRYADRPGNENFDPASKRDCQTCHMQQTYGQPGTAQTLHGPKPPLTGKLATTGPERPIVFSHHFIGGNTYSTRLVGADSNETGKAHPYPELSAYSYSSADPKSPYYNAFWENVQDTGPQTQHVRLAWDRLRNAVEVSVQAPHTARAGGPAKKLRVQVRNTGTGHNFPTGFPEGRNAWVAVRAFDLATGRELEIEDSYWKRRSLGVGYLTDRDGIDPNFPGCKWKVPAGAPDPYAFQFRAVASLGDGCPTLDLPYATPLNLVVDASGLPIDTGGKVIDRDNPLGLPQFRDLDKDGDVYDDSFLVDTRLRPMPHPEATLELDRYAVVVPPATRGPVSVTAAVYYQSMEAVVAKKFMGNMADTDLDRVLEPCVLKGPCDGRTPTTEPAVVEGAPPVPIRVQSTVMRLEGEKDTAPPTIAVYPVHYAPNAYRDVVPKVTTSEPVVGIDAGTFTLVDDRGAAVPAQVAQIADTTWALFPDPVFLDAGRTYRASISGAVCDLDENCTSRNVSWSFTITSGKAGGSGDTRPPERPGPSLDIGGAYVPPRPSFAQLWWVLTLCIVGILAGSAGLAWSGLRGRARRA